MDVERARTGPTPAASVASEAVTTAVLGNDDLLREILLRLGFPTTLVRAALVSKRWLRHASDPAFLRLFRARHPPALLGFYYSRKEEPTPPQCAHLAGPGARHRHPARQFPDDDVWECVIDCRNGRGIVMSTSALWPSSPFAEIDLLHQTRSAALFPPPLPYPDQEKDGIFLPVPEDGGVLPQLPYPEGEDDSNILPAPVDGLDGMVAMEVIFDNTRTMVAVEVIVHEACNRHDDVFVMAADNNLEYVFLWLEASRLLMHIHLRSWSEKVYHELNVYDESTLDRSFLHIMPFVMVWPPVFPAMRGEDNLEA